MQNGLFGFCQETHRFKENNKKEKWERKRERLGHIFLILKKTNYSTKEFALTEFIINCKLVAKENRDWRIPVLYWRIIHPWRVGRCWETKTDVDWNATEWVCWEYCGCADCEEDFESLGATPILTGEADNYQLVE